MKKLFLTILLILNSVALSYGAIATTTVWEVRTTGDATNGGGFNAARDTTNGVDYSQQNAAQLSLTDFACASNTTLTSATGGFTHAMEGNIIYIASGTNALAGYYEIVTYTDTNTVTIDRTCATGGNMTAGVGKVGGATDHPQRIAVGIGLDNTVHIKTGTYTRLGTNAYVLWATKAGGNCTRWIGYKTTRNDNPIGDDRPLFDATDATNGIYTQYNYHQFYCLRVANAVSSGITRLSASPHGILFYNVDSSNNGASGFIFTTSRKMYAIACSASGNSGSGFNEVITIGCFASGNSGNGFGKGDANFCIAESNTQGALGGGFSSYYTYSPQINCLAYNNTNYGFYRNEEDYQAPYINCVAISNNTYGFYQNSATAVGTSLISCNYYDNGTGGVFGFKTDMFFGNNIATDPDIVDVTIADFTLEASSALIGAGFPNADWASMVGIANKDYSVNIGVDQSDHVTAGGGEHTYISVN